MFRVRKASFPQFRKKFLCCFLIWLLNFISGNGFISADYENGGWDRNRGSVRGRGRGRGRGFRGRGRGGYNGPQFDVQQDGGYNQDVPQGRGTSLIHFYYCSFVCYFSVHWLSLFDTQILLLIF